MLTTLDTFPVNVTIGDTTYNRVRLVVTPELEARLFGLVDGQVRVVASATASSAVDPRRMVTEVPVSDGSWRVEHLGGCRCGPLGHANRTQLLQTAGLA